MGNYPANNYPPVNGLDERALAIRTVFGGISWQNCIGAKRENDHTNHLDLWELPKMGRP